jgi:hypothetical protein
VIRTACSVWGKPSPPGVWSVNALTVRVSLRPWPLSRRRWPIGASAQGRSLSRLCTVGWFAFTAAIRSAPPVATSRAWLAWACNASATMMNAVQAAELGLDSVQRRGERRDLVDFAAICTWARTTPVLVS